MKTNPLLKIIVSVVLIICFVAILLSLKSHDPIHYREYEVRAGDTLWAIAKTSDGYGDVDIREIIDDMNTKPNIQPGEVIYIPMYKPEVLTEVRV